MKNTLYSQAFATVVKTLRKQKGLSQEAVGIAGGIDPGYVSVLERRKRSGPSLEMVIRMAKGLGVSPMELVEMVLIESERNFL